MSKYLAYLRTSTDKQDLNNQKMEILEYANKDGIHIDNFIAVAASSRRTHRARRIDELLEQLNLGDTLIVTELSRLGRSTGEVIDLIDHLLQADIRIVVLKQNLMLNKEQDDIQSLTMITLLSLFAQMERMMISRRTKEALAAKKAQGVQLGKPKGTVQSSVYDKDSERIKSLIKMGLSLRKISELHLGYGSASSLSYYVQTRGLKSATNT